MGKGFNDNDLVFFSHTGQPIPPDYVSRQIKKHIKKTELPVITFHDLRHTHATMLLEMGLNLKTVSDRLGHSTISITADIYAHTTEKQQQQATEALNKAFK